MDERTADLPQSHWWESEYEAALSSPLDQPVPLVEIAYHFDLAMLGRCTERSLFLLGHAHPIPFGRLSPRFVEPSAPPPGIDAPEALAIDDPCISREQFSLRWLHEQSCFEIIGASQAKRAVTIRLPDAFDDPTELGPGERRCLPIGTWIQVSSRLLLHLDWRPYPGSEIDRLGWIGESAGLWRLRRELPIAARMPAETVVTIIGPTGSGKELVARALHQASKRRKQRFEAVVIGATSADLAAASLFGVVAGTFTGSRNRPGLLATTGKGTLFLDEIDELSTEVQVTLLRTLETHERMPVGAPSQPVSCAIVVASQLEIADAVQAGKLREDFAMRIDRICLRVPPLASRKSDIPRLLRAFFFEISQVKVPNATHGMARLWRTVGRHHPPLPMETMLSLLAYEWPGNIRELRNWVDKLAMLNFESTGPVELPALPTPTPSAPAETAPEAIPLDKVQKLLADTRWALPTVAAHLKCSLRELQVMLNRQQLEIPPELLQQVLDERKNVSQAANHFGISRTTLYAWMRRCGIEG